MAYILAIDTCCGQCSAAIWKNNLLIKNFQETAKHLQAERLPQMVEKLLCDLQIHYKDLSSIITTIGPGSFTGVRIGISYAYGIQAAIGKHFKLQGVTTMDSIAQQVQSKNRYIDTTNIGVNIRAGMNLYYVQYFRIINKNKIIAQSHAKVSSEKDMLHYININQIDMYGEHNESKEHIMPNALAAGEYYLQYSNTQEMKKVLPFYLRPSSAKIKPIS